MYHLHLGREALKRSSSWPWGDCSAAEVVVAGAFADSASLHQEEWYVGCGALCGEFEEPLVFGWSWGMLSVAALSAARHPSKTIEAAWACELDW